MSTSCGRPGPETSTRAGRAPSEPARRAGGRRLAAALLALLALLALPVATAAAAPAAADTPRLDGEYGLWVELPRDSVIVQWLTAELQQGRFELVHRSGSTGVIETGPGYVHRIAMRLPRNAGDHVTLRYGGEFDDALHETVIALRAPRRAPAEVRGVDSLYVVGDTHGALAEFKSGLRAAGLVDEQLRWAGGHRHLVLAGDLLDRGPDCIPLLWLVYRLEREAEAAGGRVHVILGNHEVMVMLGDLRYVHPRETRVAELHGMAYDRMFDVRRSLLGRWLASKPALMRVDRALITHGGVSADQIRYTVRSFDSELNRFITHQLFHAWNDSTATVNVDRVFFERFRDFFFGPNSVFWHRGYVQSEELGAELDAVLRRFGADVHVVGHTAVPGVESRYGGRLIAAHTPRFGAEMLLLVRRPDGYQPYRIRAGHPIERLR
jgi:hypothetical protein